jgi:hypothetical protein
LFSAGDVLSAANIARVADALVFIAAVDSDRSHEIIDPAADSIVSTIRSIGMAESICYIQGLAALNTKSLAETRKLARRSFESCVGSNVRFAEDTDNSMLSRHLSALTPKNLNWRSARSYMVCETATVVEDVHELNEEGQVSLCIGGYLRGQPLNAQSLIHIPGGTFPISRVTAAQGPFDAKSSHRKGFNIDGFSVVSIPAE